MDTLTYPNSTCGNCWYGGQILWILFLSFWIMRLISGFACNASRSGLFPVPMATQFTFLLSSSRQKGASRLHSFPKRTEKLSSEIKLGKETHQTQNSAIQYGRGVAPWHTIWNIHRIYWCNATNYTYLYTVRWRRLHCQRCNARVYNEAWSNMEKKRWNSKNKRRELH